MTAQAYNKRKHDEHCKSNTVYKENDLIMIRNVPKAGISARPLSKELSGLLLPHDKYGT